MLNEETTKKPEILPDESLDEVAGGFSFGPTIAIGNAQDKADNRERLQQTQEMQGLQVEEEARRKAMEDADKMAKKIQMTITF